MKFPTAVSLVLHSALLSVFVIGARFHPGMPLGLGPGDFTPVEIVGPEVLAGRPAARPPAPAQVKPRETEPKRVEPVAPELKPEKDPGIKLPDEPKKKPAKPAPADTVARAAPEPARPAAPPPDPAAVALAGVPEASAGDGGTVAAGMESGEGTAGGGGGGFGDYAYYRIAMQNKIAANWSPGFVSGEAVCIVYFRIIRSGIVVGARVEESSGIPFYDQTALRAVLESSPLPPLPAQFPEDAVGVHFRFRYKP